MRPARMLPRHLSEDIITELLKIKGLHVFPRATVLAFRDTPLTAPDIGARLGAKYVLGGTLRRAGNRLRINAQLVDTGCDFPVWAERYDREMKDVFDVQEEIARSIAQALRITLTPQEESGIGNKPTENAEAYDYLLRGRNYRRMGNLEFAMQMYERAIELDPDFALSYAGMAHVCGLLVEARGANQRSLGQIQPRNHFLPHSRAHEPPRHEPKRLSLFSPSTERSSPPRRFLPYKSQVLDASWTQKVHCDPVGVSAFRTRAEHPRGRGGRVQ